MSYDPTLPQENTDIDAAQMRSQLQGLKALIDAIPAGPPGPPGPSIANSVVDGVSTSPPGSPAAVGTSFDGTNVHFTFALPQGNPGSPGEVTNAALATAIMSTSSNSNAVATLDTPFADPDMEALRVKVNEMISALRR